MKYARFEDLPVWKEAVGLLARVDGITAHAGFRGKGDLLDQLYRATLSVSNNIAEGFESGTTEQLLTFLYHARCSAGEVRSLLRVMDQLPAFSDLKSQISGLIASAESVSKQIRAWAESLQNSGIKGQRYLTDADREQQQRRERARAFEEYLGQFRKDGAGRPLAQ